MNDNLESPSEFEQDIEGKFHLNESLVESSDWRELLISFLFNHYLWLGLLGGFTVGIFVGFCIADTVFS